MRKSTAILFVLAAAVSVGWAVSLAAHADDAKSSTEYGSAGAKAHPREAQARLAAVKKLFAVEAAVQSMGPRSVFSSTEEIHLWSCRLLEAERDLAETRQDDEAAVLRHWKRMEDVYRKVRALYDTGSKGGEVEKLARATYCRAQAELWLVEAGGTIPDDRLD